MNSLLSVTRKIKFLQSRETISLMWDAGKVFVFGTSQLGIKPVLAGKHGWWQPEL